MGIIIEDGFSKKETTVLTERFVPNSLTMGSNAQIGASLAYANNNDAYSIIRRIAKAAATVPLYVYKVKDQGALKEYDYVSKNLDFNLVKKEVLKLKAMEQIRTTHPLNMLLDNPNPLYSKSEHNEGVYIFRLLTGNSYIYIPTVELGVNAGKATEMWLLPSPYVIPKIVQGFPPIISHYNLNLGQLKQFAPFEIMHLRYFNTRYGVNGEQLIGLSPLQAGRAILDRSQYETDFSNNAFKNSGISGIVYNEDIDEASAETLSKLKNDFYREAEGVQNARKLLFQAGKIGYQQIGLGPTDMNVIESEKMTFKKMCNLYGVSDILFNNGGAATESNVKEMIRALYVNAALPEVYAYKDLLNQRLCPAYKGENLYIDCDLSGITELQEDMAKMANIFATLPIMIPNLIMEAFKYPKQDSEEMNKVYIKSGYQAIDDIANLPLTNDY